VKHLIKSLAAVAVLAAAIGAAAPAEAHHAINQQFEVNTNKTMKGTLSAVDWVNPHVYFHFDVVGADGKVTNWSFESLPPGGLRRIGLATRGFFKVGDVYQIGFSPSRNGAPIGLLNELTFPDGRKFETMAKRGQ
jgi:Family of unknown function (DUF6152)